MNLSNQLVVFTLDARRFALPLSSVERVIRMVEMTPVPGMPEIIMGVVNLQGRIVPVADIRKRFHLPEQTIRLTDQIIISRTSRRTIGIVVDQVCDAGEYPEEKVIASHEILPETDYVEGVVKLEDGLILIHDMDKFLSLEEEKAIDDAQ